MVKVVAILILTAFPVVASTSNRVVVRDSVSASHRNQLLDRLRTITGWSDLDFNVDGVLQVTNTKVDTGSKSARDLLSRAVSGNRVILFEDASSRKDVAFCNVALGKFVRELTVEADVYVVLIDFEDFRQVSGDKQARAAFDVGWAVLHELDHVVNSSQDPEHDTSAGDCEAHINKMRQELGLPVRNSYFFNYLPINNDANLVSRFVRLGFDQTNTASTKKKRYWLIWDAALVGGLNPDCTEDVTTNAVRSRSALTSRSF